MARLLMAMMACAGIGLASTASAAEGTMSRDAYAAEKDRIEAAYKADEKRCDGLKDNAEDVCEAEAKGKRDAAKADLEAQYRNTPKARYDAKVARADAEYNVAKEKCDDLKGNQKDVCVKDAKAKQAKVKADAKVEQASASGSGERVASARRDATDDKRQAQYKAEMERCDSLAGAAKDSCQERAKTRYGK